MAAARRSARNTRAELMRRLGWNREAFKALGRSVDVSIERAA
jgi:hypothetical protein